MPTRFSGRSVSESEGQRQRARGARGGEEDMRGTVSSVERVAVEPRSCHNAGTAPPS